MDRRNDRDFRPKFAPVKVGDELDVSIEAVGEKGDGIAKKDGFVLFVPNTKKGDQVKIRVTRVLRNVGFAEVAGQSSGESQAEGSSEESYDDEQTISTEESTEDSGSEDSENFGEDFEEEKS